MKACRWQIQKTIRHWDTKEHGLFGGLGPVSGNLIHAQERAFTGAEFGEWGEVAYTGIFHKSKAIL